MEGTSHDKDQVLMQKEDPVYFKEFMDNMNECRKDQLFTDITLKVADTEIKCHRNVLFAASSYFRGMFTSGMQESVASSVELKDVDPKVMSEVVEYAYTGSIDVSRHNIEALLQISSQFQFTYLKETCEDFLLTYLAPNLENTLDLYVLAEAYGLPDVQDNIRDNLRTKFKQVFQTASSDGLLSLSEEQLVEILKDNSINLRNEDIVFQLVLKWIHADIENRRGCVERIIPNIRLGFCSPEFLSQVIEVDPLMSASECQKLVQEAKCFQMQQHHHNKKVSSVTMPRACYKERLIISGINSDNEGNPCISTWFVNDSEGNRQLVHVTGKLDGLNILESVICFADNSLVLTGGHDCELEHTLSDVCIVIDDILGFDALEDKIHTFQPMLEKRACHNTVILGDHLYIFGGIGQGQHTSTLSSAEKRRLSKSSSGTLMVGQPEHIADMLRGVFMSMAVAFGHKIYILGGICENSNGTQEYDTVLDTWTARADIPVRISSFAAAVVFNDSIYIIGSQDRRCLRYTPASDSWTFLTGPTHQRTETHATVWKGRIIVSGGLIELSDRGQRRNRNLVEEYDPLQDTWCTWDQQLPCKFGDILTCCNTTTF